MRHLVTLFLKATLFSLNDGLPHSEKYFMMKFSFWRGKGCCKVEEEYERIDTDLFSLGITCS